MMMKMKMKGRLGQISCRGDEVGVEVEVKVKAEGEGGVDVIIRYTLYYFGTKICSSAGGFLLSTLLFSSSLRFALPCPSQQSKREVLRTIQSKELNLSVANPTGGSLTSIIQDGALNGPHLKCKTCLAFKAVGE